MLRSSLVAAIEAAGTLDTQTVNTEMQKLNINEFYSKIRFNSDHQLDAGMVVTQFAHGSKVLEVIYWARRFVVKTYFRGQPVGPTCCI